MQYKICEIQHLIYYVFPLAIENTISETIFAAIANKNVYVNPKSFDITPDINDPAKEDKPKIASQILI